MNMQKIVIFTGLALLLASCASKQYVKQDSALIVFKTPTFKYADMGFIYENKDEVKVEIYSSGQALMSLRILESSVCMSLLKCMSKTRFNQEVLHAHYPKDMLENIFRAKKIFDGQGYTPKGNGFTQQIVKDGKYAIHYKVLNNEITFRDTINAILIKVKKQ